MFLRNILNGCLLDDTQALEIYGDAARDAVDIKAVVSLYNHVRERMSLSPAVGVFQFDAYLKSVTVTSHLDDVYMDLFHELCWFFL